MIRTIAAAIIGSLCASAGYAQRPTQIAYTLSIDTANLQSYAIEMRIRGAADTFTLAAAAHPEYDDKYWRYLVDLQVVDGAGRAARVTRVDSVLWRVAGARGEVTARYRIQLPESPSPRAAWRPFLTRTGALVGGPHSFLYVLGAERARATVTMVIPQSWQIATGLTPRGAAMYSAENITVLMDSPLFVGEASRWDFAVNGTPHRIFYWRAPNAVAFDTVSFVRGVEGFAREAIKFFGSVPYGDYTFVFQDNAYGGLEHLNSVTLGTPSSDLARNPYAYLPETAHEFFHTWNLMRIRPREYRDVDYRTQPPVSGLWFSEGLTIFYADLLTRRAGLPTTDSTRVTRLQNLLSRYYGNPGNYRFSAEHVSRLAYNAAPGALGNYSASTHLQGEVLGTMLDLIIRDATDGARSMDDVMRLMLARFSGKPGFLGEDIERAVGEVCRCSVKSFFDSYVRSGSQIDFNRYLAPIGLRVSVATAPVVGANGQASPDLRIAAWQTAGESHLRLSLWHPESAWTKAGLNTGDRLISVNGRTPTTWPEFRAVLAALKIGDVVQVVAERASRRFVANVTVAGFQRPVARIEPIGSATDRQLRLRNAWLSSR